MKLYVGNLPYDATKDGVHELFSAHGQVADVAIIMDRETGQSKGFGFVEMPVQAEANSAMKTLDGQDFGGRQLKVNEAKPRH